ncbi:MAG TPA: multidrug efflux SMR transporter [Candidatus Thermoplasmatota archaeon]|nr:multidrug efflux SMR transporter [Candidatus Thermoplasmatota archaeon]
MAFHSAWLLVGIAGVLEVVWATLMKQSAGFTKLGYTVATIVTMVASFLLLSQAMRVLPLGTAYAVWTGIGAVGAAVVGIVWLGEPRTAWRILCIGAIVGGIIGLKVASPA